MKRYLVFVYRTYYPEGGMNDCELKTENKDEAVQFAVKKRDCHYVHVYDVVAGENILLPEEE